MCVRDVLEIIRSCDHNGFPVFTQDPDGQPKVMGVILRSHIMTLLRDGHCFQVSVAA